MMYAMGPLGNRIEAQPGTHGTCPNCQANLIPHCGQIKVWHWAHQARLDCDPWWEPETRWHRLWKQCVPADAREVVLGPHRADIQTSSGLVIELQHSPIDPSTIAAREAFYGDMVWVIDAHPFAERVDIQPHGHNVRFQWHRPRPSLYHITKPVLWDLGTGRLLEIDQLDPHTPGIGSTSGRGAWVTYRDFFTRAGVLWPLNLPCDLCHGNTTVPVMGPCLDCDGSQVIVSDCSHCAGTGHCPRQWPTCVVHCHPTSHMCGRCAGSGHIARVCLRCHGTPDRQDIRGTTPCTRCQASGLVVCLP